MQGVSDVLAGGGCKGQRGDPMGTPLHCNCISDHCLTVASPFCEVLVLGDAGYRAHEASELVLTITCELTIVSE